MTPTRTGGEHIENMRLSLTRAEHAATKLLFVLVHWAQSRVVSVVRILKSVDDIPPENINRTS